MKKCLCFLILCTPFLLFAQSSGIQWVSDLGWQDVKAKAKKENKFIFLDFFTTWCGPCKKMERETYTDSAVATFMNQKFVSVKIQMDRTVKDNDEVKRWYKDAQRIGKDYAVAAYPSLVFLSPSGELVYKTTGYRDRRGMIQEATTALKPGQKYKDPWEDYYVLLNEYESGTKNYKNMPRLFKRALDKNEPQVAWPVAKVYLKYLEARKEKELYTKANIEFLVKQSLTSHSRYYNMFYKNGKKVDKAVGRKGYAQSVIDQIILREIVATYLNINLGAPRMIGGKRDTAEADWNGLYKLIREQYNEDYAERNLLDAKLIWYDQHYNGQKFREHLLKALERFGVNTFDLSGPRSCRRLNSEFWQVFLSSSDTSMLEFAKKWMKEVVHQSEDLTQHTLYIDTYANLLYKLGRTEEAIKLEEKAIQIATIKGYTGYLKGFERTLSKMQNGEPTWK